MSSFLDRVAAAPISWGVCEAPGWGPQLPVDRVLGEMRQLGITATEQGALGWLPADPTAQRAKLDEYGMTLLGGFVPLIMHDPAQREAMLAEAERVASNMEACGGTFFVTAIIGDDEWSRPAMTESSWAELFANLDRVEAICRSHGLTQVLHPHVNTMIETDDEFDRFLASSTVRFCLDTGHLTIGGADVVRIARDQFDRIGLVHLKDVDGEVARRERAGELTLMAATEAGLFPSIGDGVVRIADVVRSLESQGYDGWYVMETDVFLNELPGEGEGPVRGVERSLAYLRSLAVA